VSAALAAPSFTLRFFPLSSVVASPLLENRATVPQCSSGCYRWFGWGDWQRPRVDEKRSVVEGCASQRGDHTEETGTDDGDDYTAAQTEQPDGGQAEDR